MPRGMTFLYASQVLKKTHSVRKALWLDHRIMLIIQLLAYISMFQTYHNKIKGNIVYLSSNCI